MLAKTGVQVTPKNTSVLLIASGYELPRSPGGGWRALLAAMKVYYCTSRDQDPRLPNKMSLVILKKCHVILRGDCFRGGGAARYPKKIRLMETKPINSPVLFGKYPSSYRVSYMSGGPLGFLPSTGFPLIEISPSMNRSMLEGESLLLHTSCSHSPSPQHVNASPDVFFASSGSESKRKFVVIVGHSLSQWCFSQAAMADSPLHSA